MSCIEMRRAMGGPGTALITAALLAIVSIPVSGQLLQPRVFDLRQLHGYAPPNMIRPTSAVLDPWRNLLYAYSPEFDHIAVVETHSKRLRPSIPLPDSLRGRLTLLHAHPRTGTLLVLLSDRGKGAGIIAAVDPLTGSVSPVFDPAAERSPRCVSDPDNDIVYMSTGRQNILLLKGRTFLPIDSIDAGIPVSGLAVDSIHADVYAAQCTPSGGLIRVRSFSTLTRQMTRSFIYRDDAGIEHIAIDAISQKFALFFEHGVRIHDALGIPLRDVPVHGGVACTATSDLSRRVFFLAREGFDEKGKPGRFGKLYRLAFPTDEVDSASVGIDAIALFTGRHPDELHVVNAGTSDVESFTIPDLRRTSAVPLGYSVEDAALSKDGGTLFITSARGAGAYVHAVKTGFPRVSVIRAGARPVQLARDERCGLITSFDQFHGTIHFLNDTLDVVTDSLRMEVIPPCRTDADASLAVLGGLAAIAFPEHASVAMIPLDASSGPRIEKLDDYMHGGESGPGLIQVVFTPDRSMLAVFPVRQRVLHVFGTIQAEPRRSIDLGSIDPQRFAPFVRSCLVPGFGESDVFIGPYRVDCRTGRIDSIAAAGIVRVLGTDTSGFALAVSAMGDSLVLLRARRKDFSDAGVQPLAGSFRDADVLRFDPLHSALLLGSTRDARVLLYNTDVTILSHQPTVNRPEITLYPNPVPVGSDVLHVDIQSSPHGETVGIVLYDILGRVARVFEVVPSPASRVDIPLTGLAPGAYHVLIRARTTTFERVVVLGR